MSVYARHPPDRIAIDYTDAAAVLDSGAAIANLYKVVVLHTRYVVTTSDITNAFIVEHDRDVKHVITVGQVDVALLHYSFGVRSPECDAALAKVFDAQIASRIVAQ